MGKSAVQRTPEENKERHDYKRRLKKLMDDWNDRVFEEQIDELRRVGLRNNNPEQG
jgi:hypothetical protein